MKQFVPLEPMIRLVWPNVRILDCVATATDTGEPAIWLHVSFRQGTFPLDFEADAKRLRVGLEKAFRGAIEAAGDENVGADFRLDLKILTTPDWLVPDEDAN